jgi:hypothetical protein
MAVSGAYSGLSKAIEVPVVIIEDLQKRFRSFPVPDGSFDASAANPALLRKYGLPPRPDPNRQPFLRRIWDRGFGAPLTLQEFMFSRDLVLATRYRPQFRQAEQMPFAETRFETSSNWSGAYITANADRQFLQIWGAWTVPGNLKLPPVPFRGPAGIDYVCSNWIGLDGQRLYFDSSLPQIGTASTLLANGATDAQAWTQWWARNTSTAPLPLGLAVTPGDQVLSVLTASDPQTVICVMVNLSTMTGMAVEGTAPTVPLPDGSNATPDIAGATAEWIVERPAIPGQPKTLYNFPDYGHTEFDLCMAVEGYGVDIFSLFGGLPQELQSARRIRMFTVLSSPARTAFISMPERRSDTAVRISYGGFPG